MIFDAARQRLIIAVKRRGREGSLRQWSDEGGLSVLTLGLKASDLPGVTDLVDRGRQSPALIPLALQGDDMLVRAVPERHAHPRRGEAPMSRTYIFDIEAGTATLVDYLGD